MTADVSVGASGGARSASGCRLVAGSSGGGQDGGGIGTGPGRCIREVSLEGSWSFRPFFFSTSE